MNNTVLNEIQEQLNQKNVTLVAVSKTHPTDVILEMYHEGQRIFGENRVQELSEKYEILPKDIEWHLIGHLQTNKVKYIAPFVSLIHSIDSLKILKEINKQAKKSSRVVDCLLQFKIAEEDTKYGLTLDDATRILEGDAYANMTNIRLVGVMGMATFTDNENQVRKEFQRLASIFKHLKNNYFTEVPHFKEISMGMSGDYEIAIEEGSTMVRIGSLLFGHRS